MKHYKVKKFSAEAKKERISDACLCQTVDDFLNLNNEGQQRFSLGAGLYKLRVASKLGKGKSGGSRTILAYKKESQIIWLHCFSKNEKGNVSEKELKKLKALSDILLNLSGDEILKLIELGEVIEVDENV